MLKCSYACIITGFVDHMLTCPLDLIITCSHLYFFWWLIAPIFSCFDVHMFWWLHASMFSLFDVRMLTCLHALMIICSYAHMLTCLNDHILSWSNALIIRCSHTHMLWWSHTWWLHAPMLTCINIQKFHIHTHKYTLVWWFVYILGGFREHAVGRSCTHML